VALNQRFVPSSEGQVHAALAGWGAAVLPRLRVQSQLESGALVNLVPSHSLPINLYWHCWNLDSAVIDRLTAALSEAARRSLSKNTTQS
jgi:LysR family transcriptional regulator (chromosome initiation inhibitor)